jgi:hypothetical protein
MILAVKSSHIEYQIRVFAVTVKPNPYQRVALYEPDLGGPILLA